MQCTTLLNSVCLRKENQLDSFDQSIRSIMQFEITIIVLDSCFRFTRIPMLRVYGHYIYIYSDYSAGIDFRRQNLGQILTSEVDPRAVRVNIAERVVKTLRCMVRADLI